jgi:hypothetical protein
MPKITGPRLTEGKDHLVQFRTDDVFMKKLSLIAERKSTPVGVLARQWVAERLEIELKSVQNDVEKWVDLRMAHVHKMIVREMEAGAVIIIHLVPLSTGEEIGANGLEELKQIFPSNKKETIAFTSSINMEGFVQRIAKVDSSKSLSYTQIFKNGRIELVKIMPENTDKLVPASMVVALMVQSVSILCKVLQALEISLPIEIHIGFSQMYGYRFRSVSHLNIGDKFTANDFTFPNCLITDWKQINNFKSTEIALSRAVSMIWNAAGLSKKPEKPDDLDPVDYSVTDYLAYAEDLL